MTFLKKLIERKRNRAQPRIRICLQCGMPMGEHKEWCAILRAQQGVSRGSSETVANR